MKVANETVGIFLVITPNKEGVRDALQIKMGMKNLGIEIMGAVLKGGTNEPIPTPIIEDALRLEIFDFPKKT